MLREVDKRIGLIQRFAGCFTDYRGPDLIEHRVEELVGQRIYGLALGYEDLNDHEQLRRDPLLGVLVEKTEPGREVTVLLSGGGVREEARRLALKHSPTTMSFSSAEPSTGGSSHP